MRQACEAWLLSGLSVLLSTVGTAGQGIFQNLDFEQASIVYDTAHPLYPDFVFASNAIPGWTAYTYGHQDGDILYNAIALSSAQVGVYDAGYAGWASLAPVQGRYSVALAGEFPGSLPFQSAAIAQTGRVPSGAESLTFWGQVGGLQITFASQSLSYAAIGRGTNYIIYGCDISAFAGQTGELRFTTLPSNSALIDNIMFSDQPIPEPGVFGLLGLGALLLGWRFKGRHG